MSFYFQFRGDSCLILEACFGKPTWSNTILSTVRRFLPVLIKIVRIFSGGAAILKAVGLFSPNAPLALKEA